MSSRFDAQLVASLKAGAAGYGLFDPQERLRDANTIFLDVFATKLEGAPTWEKLMRDCHRHRRGLLIDTDDIDAWIARVRRSYRQVPVRTFESDLVDGRWMWVSETLRPDGWSLVMMIDITALKANEHTLRRSQDQAQVAALTDGLTELPNRRHILNRLDILLATAAQMRIPLSVAVVDLDHFKRVNDAHGHAVGDRVLQHFALRLRRQLRPLDEAGRVGGEEFLLLLPNTPVESADLTLTRLREQLALPPSAVAELPALHGEFSAGITLALAGEAASSVFARAEQALLLAKSQGRQRNVVAPAPPAG
jgi:diguanylate cyclase (GGDEF)-like protein